MWRATSWPLACRIRSAISSGTSIVTCIMVSLRACSPDSTIPRLCASVKPGCSPITRRLCQRGPRYLLLLESHVLRHWEGVQGDCVHGMLGHPGAHTHQGPQIDDRRKHHPLCRELLDAM